MNYYLYILKSLKDNNLYVGCTSDLLKRLLRHKTGQVKATKHRRPLMIVYSEVIKNKADAFQRERYLKSLFGYKQKRKLIQEYKDKRLL